MLLAGVKQGLVKRTFVGCSPIGSYHRTLCISVNERILDKARVVAAEI